MQVEDAARRLGRQDLRRLEGRLPLAPGALERFAGVVDEDPPHRPGRDREEVRAVAGIESGHGHQAQVGLVYELGRLERVVRALPRQVAGGDGAQVLVHEG